MKQRSSYLHRFAIVLWLLSQSVCAQDVYPGSSLGSSRHLKAGQFSTVPARLDWGGYHSQADADYLSAVEGNVSGQNGQAGELQSQESVFAGWDRSGLVSPQVGGLVFRPLFGGDSLLTLAGFSEYPSGGSVAPPQLSGNASARKHVYVRGRSALYSRDSLSSYVSVERVQGQEGQATGGVPTLRTLNAARAKRLSQPASGGISRLASIFLRERMAGPQKTASVMARETSVEAGSSAGGEAPVGPQLDSEGTPSSLELQVVSMRSSAAETHVDGTQAEVSSREPVVGEQATTERQLTAIPSGDEAVVQQAETLLPSIAAPLVEPELPELQVPESQSDELQLRVPEGAGSARAVASDPRPDKPPLANPSGAIPQARVGQGAAFPAAGEPESLGSSAATRLQGAAPEQDPTLGAPVLPDPGFRDPGHQSLTRQDLVPADLPTQQSSLDVAPEYPGGGVADEEPLFAPEGGTQEMYSVLETPSVVECEPQKMRRSILPECIPIEPVFDGVIDSAQRFTEGAASLAPSLTCRPGCLRAGVGREWVVHAPFEVDTTQPLNQIRLGMDLAYDFRFPNRSEYFWSAAPLGPAPESSVDYQDFRFTWEAGGRNMSVATELPIRAVNPVLNANHAGFGDMNVTTKLVLKSGSQLQMTQLLRVYIKTGSTTSGLSSGHVSMEPGFLVRCKINERNYFHSQLKYWFPLGGNPLHGGEVINHGYALSHLAYDSDALALVYTAEAVHWVALNGLRSTPGGGLVSVDGDNIMNMYLGARVITDEGGDLGPVTYGMNWGTALTGHKWYASRFQFEIRFAY